LQNLQANNLLNAGLTQTDGQLKPDQTKDMKKRDAKGYSKKKESIKFNEKKDFSTSPQLFPLGTMGGHLTHSPGGMMFGASGSGFGRRKQTLDGQQIQSIDPEIGSGDHGRGLHRKMSGNYLKNDDDVGSVKSSRFNMSTFKSPILGNGIKNFAESFMEKRRKPSMISNTFRKDRLGSVFRKDHHEDFDQMSRQGPLFRGTQGEPSFGAASKHESGSINHAKSSDRIPDFFE